MAKREQYEVRIVCDKCGQEGRMEAEENENPLQGRDLEIEKVTSGFTIKEGNAVCDNCGTIVVAGSN